MPIRGMSRAFSVGGGGHAGALPPNGVAASDQKKS